MPTTKDDIDSFYEFATSELNGGQAEWSLEECVLRWRRQRANKPVDFQPFDDGKSLKDKLEKAGILGCGTDGPTDLATNPKHMDGFGESRNSCSSTPVLSSR